MRTSNRMRYVLSCILITFLWWNSEAAFASYEVCFPWSYPFLFLLTNFCSHNCSGFGKRPPQIWDPTSLVRICTRFSSAGFQPSWIRVFWILFASDNCLSEHSPFIRHTNVKHSKSRPKALPCHGWTRKMFLACGGLNHVFATVDRSHAHVWWALTRSRFHT